MPECKTLPARVKAVDDAGDGVVEAIVATYDVDSIGDRIVPGAFAKSLDQWRESGDSIPFIWSHMHDDIDAYLGDVIEAKETDDGLWVRAQLDMDDEKSRKAFKLIKGGRVRNYSFAYEVRDSEEKDGEMLLRELHVFEVGPTLVGMNQQTRTLVAKRSSPVIGHVRIVTQSDDVPVKRGRVLSASNEESLRAAYDAIGGVLAKLDSQSDDDESSEVDDQGTSDAPSQEPEKHDEPDAVKCDEPTPSDPADDDLALELSLLTRKGV